jgi:hypothetical protein
MNGRLPFAVITGVVAAAALFLVFLAWRGGDRLEPTGNILKVRSIAADEQHAIIVLDLRIVNTSNVALEVRQVSLSAEIGSQVLEGKLVSGVDTPQLFTYYPALGEAYNPPLIAGSRIAPHETKDFMLAARLDTPEQQIGNRQKLTVSVQDRSGVTVQLLEKGK